VQQGEGAQHQVARVQRAAVGQQPLVVGVQPGELAARASSSSAWAVSSSGVTIACFSRSMRDTKPASSGAGLPRISWRRSVSPCSSSSSSATRSAGATGTKSGSRPASTASSRRSASQKEPKVCTESSS
jgi:hypothetical protein